MCHSWPEYEFRIVSVLVQITEVSLVSLEIVLLGIPSGL